MTDTSSGGELLNKFVRCCMSGGLEAINSDLEVYPSNANI